MAVVRSNCSRMGVKPRSIRCCNHCINGDEWPNPTRLKNVDNKAIFKPIGPITANCPRYSLDYFTAV